MTGTQKVIVLIVAMIIMHDTAIALGRRAFAECQAVMS